MRYVFNFRFLILCAIFGPFCKYELCCNSALTVLFLHSVLPDGPIITEDELTSLPLVKVVPDGQYTGPKLNTVVRMMRGLLEQKVPLQEFEVRICFEF